MALGSDAVVEDVSVLDVWKQLEANKKAQLVDVRTRPEWAFVGVPDISELGRRVLMIEWQTFPDSRVDPAFEDRLKKQINEAGVEKDADLFFHMPVRWPQPDGGRSDGSGGIQPLSQCGGRFRGPSRC